MPGTESGGLPYVVALNGVSRRFPPDVAALQDVSFRVRAAESVALRGASGSGETTLLALLGLLDTPTTGSFELQGVETTTMTERDRTRARRRALAFVFQAFHLVPHLTALENVRLGMHRAANGIESVDSQAREALDGVGLSHRLQAFPATLSGGEQQRVAVARALVRAPALLLCDEPTGNLDSRSSSAALRGILAAAGAGTAVIIATHDEAVARHCMREIQVHDGQIRELR